jgi:hypothetical protein
MVALLALMAALPGPFQIGPAELPWAAVDRAYTQALTVRGGDRCANNDLHVRAEGSLPAGLELTSTGQFTGVPVQTGTYRIVIQAENICGHSSRPLTLTVTGAPILTTSPDTINLRYRREGTASSAQIQVRSTWPGLEYSIEKSAAPWLRAIPRSARTPRPGSALECDLVELKVEASDLAPGVYSATLRFSTWQGANAPVVTVRLTVE